MTTLSPKQNSAVAAGIRRAVFITGSLGSITAMLIHIYGVMNMMTFTLTVCLPLCMAMLAVWLWARSADDDEFLCALRCGFWGGVWGTIGYDLARLPFHGHYNLFGAIRFYGMWLCDEPASSAVTDAAGMVYHFSNGITFGWLYALVALRRHWAWALVWGLLLESLAVFTVFGEVFAIRGAGLALVLAYAAHLAYGWPLGMICQNPERAAPWTNASGRWLAGLLVVTIFVWFSQAWQPQPSKPSAGGSITLHDKGFYPGVAEVEHGSSIRLVNDQQQPVTFVFRRVAQGKGAVSETFDLNAGQAMSLPVDQCGLHQLVARDKPFRSVLVMCSRDGEYTNAK